MKRKILLSAVISALVASGASAQVVNFHDADNWQALVPETGYFYIYNELFAGQGAFSDPGDNIWNGYGHYGAFQGWFFSAGRRPQNLGNPGNPYACYNNPYGANLWVSCTGTSLFEGYGTANPGSVTTTGNATSDGQWTPVTLQVAGVPEDAGLKDVAGNTGVPFTVPNGSPAFLVGNYGFNSGATPDEVFTLQNVPAGAYGLYLYGVNYAGSGGTLFSVNSGSPHNGIAATVNGQVGALDQTYVEGQNFVIFENVTPDTNGNITITASPNNLAGETYVNGIQLIFHPPPTAVGCTAAQNVWAGGTANFSFSPAFGTNYSFRWQSIIGGLTNNLSDTGNISGSATTNLTVAGVSSANVGLYQCVISTATASNTSPAAPLTILTSAATGPLQQGDPIATVGYILQPGDTLSDLNNSTPAPESTIPPCGDMTVTNVEDNTLYQYANFGANGDTAPFSGPVSFMVTPNFGSAIVTGMRFFTASSHPEDDPADYLLQGSTDGGATFTTISSGPLALPAQRNAAGGPINITNQVLQEIDFTNSTPYTTYQLTFNDVVDDNTASNGVQIAEVQLLGSLPPVPPGIVQQPEAAEVLLVGGTLNASVVVNGPGPLSYQWYYNTTHQIPNATNATLTLANMQATNDGSYSCVISNSYGPTNSTTLSLTVVAPTPYQQTLLALHPLGYWPLNETSGTTAFDYANGYNGTYDGNITLAQSGVPFAGFGSPSYSAGFDGSSTYVDIPEGPFNLTSPITVLGWVQSSGSSYLMDILGHGDSSYSLAVTAFGAAQFADDGGNCTNATAITDENWHLVAGVYTGGSGANDLLYVDGVLVASNATTSVAGSAYDLWIGGAPDYGTGSRLFSGNLCHVAVIPQGLSADQIQQIYAGADPAPAVSVPSSPITVDQDGPGAVSATATGGHPLFYQWYYFYQNATVMIPGATNGTLQLTNIQLIQGSYQYDVVVSNAYGVVTSSYATLNILSGVPVIATDIAPLLDVVPAGTPVTFSVGVSGGTWPWSYQWSQGSGAITGATNSSYTFNALAGSNTYSVTVRNSDGPTTSSTAVVLGVPTPPPTVAFNGNGPNWSLNGGNTFNTYVATMSDNVLAIISGGDESTSAFFKTPQYIGAFFASFTYTVPSTSGAGGSVSGGTTFCLQNSTQGAGVFGEFCGGLGLEGITPSAALSMSGASLVAFCTNGTIATGSSTSPVNLDGGDPISVQLYYSQNVLTVVMTDAMEGTTFTTSYETNLPAILGSEYAFVGFTGGTCAPQSVQNVSDFTFLPDITLPTLSIAQGTAGSVIVSWPASTSSSFGLQSSSSLAGPWSAVSTTPTIVNGQNQVTLTPGPAPGFYRLVVP
jgi:hypothetical protein